LRWLEVTGTNYVAWDNNLPGFGVRVRPSGAKSYIVFYRAGSGQKAPLPKLTIDAVGKLASDEARNSKENPRIGGERGGSPATKTEARKTLTVSELVVRAHFRSSGEHTATVDRDMRVGAKAAEELLEANGAWTR
jgi:Arm DNA-binding domain